MAFKLRSSKKEPISEINVTPFVDVMLVLLIIFMVTAPLLTVGVQVDLPETSADTLPEETEPLTLTINAKGEIFIQETKVEYEKIIAKIMAVSNNRTDTRIFVRGDKINSTVQRLKKHSPRTATNVIGLGEKHDLLISFLEGIPDDTLVFAIGNQVGAGQEILEMISKYRHNG